MSSRNVLQGEGVTLYFGGLAALKGVDFHVDEGEIVGLIGPNGSGKSSLFNLISGLMRPTHGRITFLGHDLARFRPHQIAHLGVGRTFQIVRPFAELTTLQNVTASALYGQRLASVVEAEHRARDTLRFVGLVDHHDQPVRDLPLAFKKRLEIARALATGPKLLLLDEVFAGLNPVEIDGAIELIFRIRDELDITVFMIEHVMKAAMQTCQRIMVLGEGKKIAEGLPQDIARDAAVLAAYLGPAYA
ncbi:MAG: ABC transporter ATP-binding protein [Chloroflexi bacterium]|nr:ABC transporter ATP-binding protein [Chloroflexota bacterium]MDA8189673.1 ABC transporter ATP-binding protein [Dehalococcoidales bacterium]